ncbi:hypothetical protein ACOME3_008781 [Neoechinorhynchus agilis]
MVALLSCFLFYLATGQLQTQDGNITIAAFEKNWQIRPVIGILAQETNGVFEDMPDKSYLPASYVKYVESAGGVALPIRLNRKDEYYRKIFENIHGLILPGGGVSVDNSEYARLSRMFFEWAKKANDNNDTFPIMGICLGFEQLFYLVAEKNPLTYCRGRNYNTNIIPTKKWSKCKMLSLMSEQMSHDVTCKNITYNYHQYCVEPETFNSSKNLRDFFLVGALSYDLDGLPYIAYAEARRYPFYAFQWHPERPLFEWTRHGITHARESIKNGHFYVAQFIDEAMKSRHEFREKYFDLLVYNYQPTFTGSISPFMQSYIFDDFSDDKNY